LAEDLAEKETRGNRKGKSKGGRKSKGALKKDGDDV